MVKNIHGDAEQADLKDLEELEDQVKSSIAIDIFWVFLSNSIDKNV